MTRPTTPRRVLIIVENLPVPFDTRVWNEATTLAAHGYEVSVICPIADGYERRFEVIGGVFVYRHPLPSGDGALAYIAEYLVASFRQFRLAWRAWRERGFDVIHACNPPDTVFVLGLFYRLLGKRFIFDHHDLSPELYSVKFGRRDLFYKLLLRLERWTFRAADVVIATNESYRRVAIERGGVDPRRVWVVRSGPRPERMRIVPPNPTLRRGRKYLVGYVGLMARQEGIGHLLEAVRYIVHDLGRHDVQFHLVGDGSELQTLREQSVSLRVADYVTFVGRVGDNDLVEMLSTADVCVSPDDANELNDKSTMNKIMEYMAVGKPIVQFETTEGRFSAQDASLYARPHDAEDFAAKIVELLGDPERRKAMGEVGRERVRNELAWSHQVPNLLAAYDAAFGAGPASPTGSVIGEPEGGNPRSEPAEITVKGNRGEVPAVRLHGETVVLPGKWLRIARIHDEDWVAGSSIDEPESFIRRLKSVSPRPDIFTFAQHVSESQPRYPYAFEWEDAAAISITTYADWWNGLPQVARKNVRRAARRGVVVERVAFDDALIRGIKEIYDETPIRQGRRFWHYGKDLESVKRANASYLDRSEFLAAYHDRALIGFIKLVYVDDVARIMQILCRQGHSDKRPSNALLARAVEACCQRGMTYFIYGRYSYGSKTESSLIDFKRRNGFERIQFPRYFVPLTRKGEAAMALKLHLGFERLVPRRVTHFLLNARAALFARNLAGSSAWKASCQTTRSEAAANRAAGRSDVRSPGAGVAQDRAADP